MKLNRISILLLFLFVIVIRAADRIDLDEPTRARCLEVLRAGLLSDEFWPSMHAAEGLTLGGHGGEVRVAFAARLETEKDDQRRCGLARELVRAGDEKKRKVMLDILRGEDDHGHVHAAESLYKVGGATKAKPVRAAFAQTKNANLQLMAAAALGQAGDAKALAFLREQMRSAKDPKAFTIVAWVLGRIGGSVDCTLIRSRLADVPDPLGKAYLQHALAALGNRDGQMALSRNLESGNPSIRVYAAVFAGDARMTSVKPQLIRLLEDETLDVRIRAAQSLLVLAR